MILIQWFSWERRDFSLSVGNKIGWGRYNAIQGRVVGVEGGGSFPQGKGVFILSTKVDADVPHNNDHAILWDY